MPPEIHTMEKFDFLRQFSVIKVRLFAVPSGSFRCSTTAFEKKKNRKKKKKTVMVII